MGIRTVHPTVNRGPIQARSVPVFLFILALAGCSQTSTNIFEEHQPPIVWPAQPAQARIRYVGQLSSSEDLKASRNLFQQIGDFLVGAEEPGRLYGPRSAICLGNGRWIWVADPGGRCLHQFDLEDRSYRKIHRVGDSVLLSPVDLCIGPEGSIFVCDSEAIMIHRLSAKTGDLLETLFMIEDLKRPAALIYREAGDELFVVDVVAHDIKVLSRDGGLKRTIGGRGRGDGEFNFPCDIADDGRWIWVADTGNHRVQALTYDGDPVTAFGQAGDSPGDMALPKGIAFDGSDHIYVVDGRFENIQIFDRSGRLLLFFGEEGSGAGEFWLPGGVFVDSNDRIWICDSYNGRIQVFDYLKEVEDEAGR